MKDRGADWRVFQHVNSGPAFFQEKSLKTSMRPKVMSVEDLLLTIQDVDTSIENGLVYVDRAAVGLLVPSSLISPGESSAARLLGPRGMSSFQAGRPQDVWAGLISSGSILFGGQEEVMEVRALLDDVRLSRTAAYFCTISKNCDEVLRAMKAIRAGVVAIVGAGGIGSLVAMTLAGAGIGKLRVVDPDVVEPSNLNRQFFYGNGDIGGAKVDALARTSRERYPEVLFEPIQARVTRESIESVIDGADAVVVSADEPLGISAVVFEASRRLRIRTVSCGYFLGRAGVRFEHAPADPPKLEDADPWMRLPGAIMPSFGPTNVELAGLASSWTLLALAGMTRVDSEMLEGHWDTATFPRAWSLL